MDINIRQATLEDRERIGHFLQTAYEERAKYKFPARWHWLFVENPFWAGARLPIWLAEVDGQIAGQTCEMVVPLKLGGGIYPAAWGVDYIVLPQFRRHGIGRLLQRAQSDYHDIFMALSMSPISRQVLVDLGFEAANPAIELHKTIRVSPDRARKIVNDRLGAGSIVSRALTMRPAATALAAFLSLFRRLRHLARQRPGTDGVTLERVERFGDEVDELWARLAPRFPAIVQRDAAYLNWKFIEQPWMQYDKFVAWRAKTPCGYVITRTGTPPEAKVGIVADLFAAPDDDAVIRRLLWQATEHLRRAGVQQIVAASSVPEYVAHFLQQGFRRTREVVPMVRGRTIGEVPTGDWFLSMGDHDWDQFPLVTASQPQGT